MNRTEKQQRAYDERIQKEVERLEAECSFAKISKVPEELRKTIRTEVKNE